MSVEETSRPQADPTRQGRRRFLGTGSAVAPALLTLASQPALGVTCFTPSRNLSKNTSVSQQGKNGDCTGTKVSTYKGGFSGSVPSNTPFHSLYSGNHFYCKKSTNPINIRSCTLLEVLNLNPNSPTPPYDRIWCDTAGNTRAAFPTPPSTSVFNTIVLAQHMIAAYLNCAGGKVPANVLTANGMAPSCTDIWSDFIVDGKYEVMASVYWDAGQIVDYLISNAIAPA